MNLERLKFVKNIDDNQWAYSTWEVGHKAQLNWPSGCEANADKAERGDLVLLIQKPNHIPDARVTHLVKIMTDQADTIDQGEWNIVRKVCPI